MEENLESRFQSIFNHVNEGILIANDKGQILLSNPKVMLMFGYEDNELKGKDVEILIPSKFRDHHVDHRETYMKHPVRRPMGRNMTLFGLRKDGSEFPLEISLSYYESSDGMFVIAFIIDITERFRQQEAIKQMNEELRLLNENLERKVNERTLVLKEALTSLEHSRDELGMALSKEKELNEMKSRFISMASHEFRTPLSTVLSSVSLISKYTENEDQDKRDKHILRIKSAVRNLTEILNDFLSLGKLEEGMVRANIISMNVREAVDEVITDMHILHKPGQRLIFDHRGKEEFPLDKQMFRNVMINLLANAIKFSPENEEIAVHSAVLENSLELSVEDHGIGISEQDQNHLFERFFRGENATNIQGTGLGLNIVLKYIELMNGSIQCESALDNGTKFLISIPRNELTPNHSKQL
ncbi:MAG: PAS domain-containing sensor histidine kinase [Flavobacteriales bacterium]|nr:PAS domain-containing sensor histidine kinase [Flavobacteriales bacterium]